MITITKNKIYTSEVAIYELNDINDAVIVNNNDILCFLSDYVDIGESVTLERLFDIIADNVEKFNEVFFYALGGYMLEPYIQEIQNNPTDNVGFEYLEVYWETDIYKDDIDFIPSLHGRSKEDTYGLDFTSLNNIKNLKVKLNNDLFLNNTDINQEKIRLGTKQFTLFDLFYSLFVEISFHGGPQEKEEMFSEINNMIDDIKENNNISETFSVDDMLDKMEKDDIYSFRYRDELYRIDEDRVKNLKNVDKLKNCLLEKLKIYDIILEDKSEDLTFYYKKLTNNEYNMQLLYGEEEDITYHKFWRTPKCTCPKIDNAVIYPSNKPIFDKNCPIHKNI